MRDFSRAKASKSTAQAARRPSSVSSKHLAHGGNANVFGGGVPSPAGPDEGGSGMRGAQNLEHAMQIARIARERLEAASLEEQRIYKFVPSYSFSSSFLLPTPSTAQAADPYVCK